MAPQTSRAGEIADYLAASPGPVTQKKLEKELKADKVVLQEAAASGAVHAWPKYRGAARYWHRDPSEVVRQAITTVLAGNAMPKRELVTAASRQAFNFPKKAVEATLSTLVKSGTILPAKPVGPTAFYYLPDHTEALARAAHAAVDERLARLGIDSPAPRTVAAPPPATHESEASLSDRILEALRRLQPAPAVPVTVQSIRAAVPNADKLSVDRAILALADQQKVYLTTHDHGWALPEAQREELVFDGGQKLYVAVTLRS